MPDFLLTQRAKTNLGSIYDDTLTRFGRYQAEAYYAGFERTFGLLAQFPRMGISADELKPGYRRFQFQSHYIFYTDEVSHILIRALYHVRDDIRPNLFS